MTPTQRLPDHVRVVSGYHSTGLAPGQHLGAPGTHLVWVLDLDGSYRLDAEGTRGARNFASSVSGLSMLPATIHHGATHSGLYVEVAPALAPALFGVPAAALAGASVELDQLWGSAAGSLLDRLHDRPPADRASLLVELIGLQVGHAVVDDDAARLWRLATRGYRPSWLAAECAWSTRHVRRMVREQTGLTPGRLARLARFERSLDAVRRAKLPLATAAIRHGYADQSHLTREWHEFLGMPPAAFLRRREFLRAAVGGG